MPQKDRVIDTYSFASSKSPDRAWNFFANTLMKSFGALSSTDPHFKHCYCAQRAREDFDVRILESLIFNVPPALLDIGILLGKEKFFPLVAVDKVRDEALTWTPQPYTPFLIVGNVGTGKTSLIDYVFNVNLKDTREILAIIVDFKVAPLGDSDFKYHLLQQIGSVLKNKFPNISMINRATLELLFNEEVANAKSTLRTQNQIMEALDRLFSPFPTCEAERNIAAMETLAARKIKFVRENEKIRSIWLVIDNIDQHISYLEEKTLVDCVGIGFRLNVNVMIAMRTLTLETPHAINVYDAYRPRKLNVSLPDITELLRRRINLFEEYAKDSDILQLSPSFRAKQETIGSLLKDIKQCIVMLAGHGILIDFLLPLSNYNLRRLLDMFLDILQSYYFFYDYYNNERYRPERHNLYQRVLYALLLKNCDYHNPTVTTRTHIVNLFDNDNKYLVYNHTIRIRILQLLDSYGKQYPTIHECITLLCEIFNYEIAEVRTAIKTLLLARLLSVTGGLVKKKGEDFFMAEFDDKSLYLDNVHVSISTAGQVHLKRLLLQLEYIEMMRYSTYVYVQDMTKIQQQQDTFIYRKTAVHAFLEYLSNQEKQEIAHFVKDKDLFEKKIGSVFIESHFRNINFQIERLDRIHGKKDIWIGEC